MAYSLNQKTVIRAGGGIYYVRDIGNAQFDLVRNAPFSTRRSENAQSALIPSLNWQVPFVQNATPSFILVNQYNQNTPYVPQWSLGVERQVTGNSSLEVSYLGSAGVHLQRLLTYNTATPGPPTNINNRRPQFRLIRRHVPGDGRSFAFVLSRSAGSLPATVQPRRHFPQLL